MAIKLKDEYTKTIPAVVLDRLHIERFTLTQNKSEDTTQRRKLAITAAGRRYGVTPDGTRRVFDDEVVAPNSTDFDKDFVTYLVGKCGYDPATVEDKIAQARAAVNAEYQAGQLSREKLLAYVELGLALVFEVKGLYEIQAEE